MLAHAAGLSARGVRYGTYVVVLAARDEDHLAEIAEQLQVAGVEHVAYREPDHNDQLMSIGVVPVKSRKEVKRILSSLPLLWKNAAG